MLISLSIKDKCFYAVHARMGKCTVHIKLRKTNSDGTCKNVGILTYKTLQLDFYTGLRSHIICVSSTTNMCKIDQTRYHSRDIALNIMHSKIAYENILR